MLCCRLPSQLVDVERGIELSSQHDRGVQPLAQAGDGMGRGLNVDMEQRMDLPQFPEERQ